MQEEQERNGQDNSSEDDAEAREIELNHLLQRALIQRNIQMAEADEYIATYLTNSD